MIHRIGLKEISLDPVKTFHALFDESPNPTCLLVDDIIVDCNSTFIEKCGFNELSEVLNVLKTTESRIGYDDDVICDFTCKTVKGKLFGGQIALSENISKDNVKLGFIQFGWIEGFDEFSEMLDKLLEYIKGLKENNAA